MESRCLTLPAVATLLVLALGSPLASAGHNIPPSQPLELSVRAIDATVLPGESATWNLTLRNPNAELLPREAALNVTTTLPAGWSYELTRTLSVPSPGNASTTLTLYVPEDAAPQQLTFVVEASEGGHFARENATVTVQARPTAQTTAVVPPDLALDVSSGDSGQSGTLVEGELVLRNLDATRTVNVRISALPRSGWSPYVRAPDANRVLGPGAQAAIPLFVQVPSLLAEETVALDVVVVDPDQGVSETIAWTVTGRPGAPSSQESEPAAPPAATPSSPSAPASSSRAAGGPNLDVFVEPVELAVTSGADSIATVRVVNSGSTPLVVTLRGESPPSWPGFLFEPMEPLSLAPGEEARVDLRVPVPAGIPVGGRADGAVSALAEGGLARRATFRLLIADATPADTSTAARIDAPIAASSEDGLGAPVALVVVGLAAVGAGAAALASRPLREKLLWGAAGLYTRLARPDVLGHEDREKLYHLVETQPGIHFHALQRDLGWNTGTLTYHLRVLERHGFVVSRRDGLYRRFYLSGAAPRKEVFENQGPTGLRADVLEAVRTQPGISQSDLALGLGANKQTVNYHVKALERAGTIRLEKRGRDTYLYPGEPPAAGPSPPGRARV